jgi:hypothetical protein
MQTTVDLEALTKQELVKLARLTYGLQVNTGLHKHDLVTMIEKTAGQFAGNAHIQVDDDSALKPGHARIKINRTELNKKGRPVICGLQGTFYSLPVGIELTVPLSLVEILNNAVQYQYEPDPENDNELVRRDVHAYPYTLIEMTPYPPKQPEPVLTEKQQAMLTLKEAQAAVDDLELMRAEGE